jgi:hypothetical protein
MIPLNSAKRLNCWGALGTFSRLAASWVIFSTVLPEVGLSGGIVFLFLAHSANGCLLLAAGHFYDILASLS